MSEAPFFDLPQTAVQAGSPTPIAVHSGTPVYVEHRAPSGARAALAASPTDSGANIAFSSSETGLHTLRATDADGDVAEAMIYVRKPWSWYLDKARDGAFEFPQRATSHAESWYGLYSMYEAARYLPDAEKLAASDEVLNTIYPVLYDPQTNAPIRQVNRI